MKPVTELYEAAEHESSGNDNRLMSALGGIDVRARAQGQSVPALLRLLDLVAMLPPERLRLVRWVVGLTASDCALLRWSIADGTCNTMARVLPEDSTRLQAMFSGLHAALSGGEGGAKEATKPTSLPAGKPPPCLRVGMRLKHPDKALPLTLLILDEPVAYVRGMGLVGWVQTALLLTWPLAEPFTVDGE